MDRQDRNRRNYENPGLDERRYEGYSRNNDQHHRARNSENQFQREYQRKRGRWDNDRNRYGQEPRYNEGSYQQGGGEGNGFRSNAYEQRNDRDGSRNYSDNFSRDRDRFGNYQDDFRGDQGIYNQDRDRSEGLRGNIRQGYGISSFDGTSDRFNTLNSDDNRDGAGEEQAYYSGARDGYRSSRFGGGTGDAFPSSHRGVPDTNYGISTFADAYGTGMGSSYGGKNFGGGTGYASGHRGGSFGNHTYGTSAGNYGGYGAMGNDTYGGRSSGGDTSHNSDRGITELGGF